MIAITKKETCPPIEEDDEKEKEYHGEIESVASSTNNDNDNDEKSDEEDIFKIITENQVSINPPPSTSPLVLVNLESLCGCPPENEAEKSILVRQLMEALLGGLSDEEKDDNGDGDLTEDEQSENDLFAKNGLLGDGFSLDFDERVTELFESGVASHADSSHPVAIANATMQMDGADNEEKKRHCREQQGEQSESLCSHSISRVPFRTVTIDTKHTPPMETATHHTHRTNTTRPKPP